jgi:hypothetical protein
MQLHYALCGGNAGPVWPPLQNRFPAGANMTAISWLYRRHLGFALAADGRSGYIAETLEEEKHLSPPHTKQRKIFVTRFKGRDIAYALSGMVLNTEGTLDLIRESDTAFSSPSMHKVQNVYEYIDEFANLLKAAVDKAKLDGHIKRYVRNSHCPPSEENVFARVFFAGYFCKHEPSFAIVTLRHDDKILLSPERRVETPPENSYLMGASGVIQDKIYGSEDHWVKEYAKPVGPDGSLDDLVSLAEGFIRACCDPRAQEIDPSCINIGGHVHVAELTPSGFKWRIPPIEEETSNPVTAP